MTISDSQKKTPGHLLLELTSAEQQSTQRFWTTPEPFLSPIFVNILHGVLRDRPICLQQIVDGLQKAVAEAGRTRERNRRNRARYTWASNSRWCSIAAVAQQTSFTSDWAGFDIRGGLEKILGVPVHYLNDGNAAAVWGHTTIFGNQPNKTSVSAIIGTGLGGGIIHKGNCRCW